jgi:two-component system chemotaxis response regulator CheB
MAATTGGPQALSQLLPKFPPAFPGSVIVVQQMRPGFTRVLADQLSHTCKLPICEPEDGQALQSSRILMIPADTKPTIANVGDKVAPAYTILLEDIEDSPESSRSRVDALMTSVAEIFGQNAIGVLLTGLGSDGREGMRAIVNAGGTTIAQDEATSAVHTLPLSAIEASIVQEVLPLWNIAERVVEITGGYANAAAA